MKKEIEINKPEIQWVYPNEFEEARKRMFEIRFDCKVKMYDSADSNTGEPQWFKLDQHFTLEFIEYSSEYEIGAAIKHSYLELQRHIKKFNHK